MKIIIKISTILFIINYGCDDIFEEDLTDTSIQLISPADSAEINTGDVLFWWDYIDVNENYHEEYNLTVVAPDFDNVQQLVLDTSIQDNKFLKSLPPGNYQFWVYAFNGSSYSDTSVRSFVVLDSTTYKSTPIE